MSSTVVRHNWSVVKEHRELRHTLGRIEAMLANPPRSAARDLWLADLCTLLDDLLPRLDEHFEGEEKSGFFSEIELLSPGDAGTAKKLMDEHPSLYERLEELDVMAKAKPLDDIRFHMLVVKACGFARDLAHHEERENELIFRSLEGDTAGLD